MGDREVIKASKSVVSQSRALQTKFCEHELSVQYPVKLVNISTEQKFNTVLVQCKMFCCRCHTIPI